MANRGYLLLKRFARRLVPIGLLATTLGAAALVHFREGMNGQVLGFARVETEAITSPEPARISFVKVDLGQTVLPGDVVAQLDTSLIDAEITVAQSERDELSAAVASERARNLRHIDESLAELERDLAKAKEEQARVGAEAAAVRAESDRVAKLVATKQAIVDDLSRLGIRESSLAPLVAVKPKTIALMQTQAEDLKRARNDLGPLTADLEAKVDLAEKKLDRLKLRREGYTLKAARSGRVAEVLKRAGELVDPTTPILRLVSATTRVVACVPEGQHLQVVEGTMARLRPKSSTVTPLRGTVVARSPLVGELPPQCRVNPSTPAWGREVVVSVDTSIDLVAGQSFEIEFLPGTSTLPEASSTSDPVAPPVVNASIHTIKIPDALQAETRFEPSGIAIEDGGKNYLVVSDDTGVGNDRLPLLFRMSPKGEVSRASVPIEGIDELTDLESIVVSPAGETYVLSSQSRSKRGKRPKPRTAFLRLEREGDAYRVKQELHLAEYLEGAGQEALKKLGLAKGSTDDFEIEGMAMRDGALYLGLKAPLDESGRAMIWKVASPKALLDGKSIEAAGLGLFAKVKLTIGESSPVEGGIAELLFLKDGSLLVSATPSAGDVAVGAIFRVKKPDEPGPLKPELVQAFPGRKPEGLSRSLSSPTGVVVVFDNGSRPGEYLELELP